MKSKAHFEWIDALRGLSALAIVLHHVRVDLWIGWNAIRAAPQSYSALDRAAAWLSVPTPFFHSAVMLFFLVSGFCIHYPHAAGGRKIELAAYMRRRLCRIYPPYLAAVALTLGIEALLSTRGQAVSAPATIVKSVLMLQNYGSGAGQMNANPSLWSLPVEVELYIAYLLFAGLTARYGLRRSMLVAGAVSMAALGLLMWRDWSGAFYHPPTNFALFWVIWCAGAALAEVVKRNALPAWKPWMSLATLAALGAALGCSLSKRLPGEVQFFTWAAFYGSVLLWGLTRPDPLSAWSARTREILMLLGTISYSLYLIHFPLFRLFGALWVQTFGAKPSNFLVGLGFSLLMLPLAWVFHWAIERPSHRLAKGLAPTKTPAVTSTL